MMLRLPGIADVYGNGTLCIGICRGTGEFVCMEAATGKELWTIDLQSTTADIASCDIDGDGKEEFIAGTTDGRLLALGVDARGAGAIKWSMTFGYSLGNPVVADADGDGLPEVMVVSGDGTLLCIGKET
jgi:outer membrane protein assembly factor BamB